MLKKGFIAKKALRLRIEQWGIVPTDKAFNTMWKIWDKDGNGYLDFRELYTALTERDYPETDAEQKAGKHPLMHDISRGFTQKEKMKSLNDVFLTEYGIRKNKGLCTKL